MPLHNNKFGIAPSLPLRPDKIDGLYALTKNLRQNTAQNLKHLILTAPGERLMDINFGVGLRNYIFEQNDVITRDEISENIGDQVSKYLPYVQIDEITFTTLDEQLLSSEIEKGNTMGVRIIYSITGEIYGQDNILDLTF
jgi:phage baseplate assembly protein W